MTILAVGGIPVRREEEPKPVSTDKKIQILKAADEDYEFYPTTPEFMKPWRNAILIAMGEKIAKATMTTRLRYLKNLSRIRLFHLNTIGTVINGFGGKVTTN